MQRCQARAKVIQKEDARGRQSQCDRELQAWKKQYPGHKGPRVFVWKEDLATGHIIRRNVMQGEISIGVWRNYSNKCKVYDSVWNEWDIIEELTDCPTRPWDDNSNNSNDYDSYFNAQPVSSGNDTTKPTDSTAIMRLPTPTQVVSDLNGTAGRNNTVVFIDNAAVTCASTPILVVSEITSMGSDATTTASSTISMISDLTSYVVFDFTSMGLDINNTTSSSMSTVSDLTSSSGLVSVAAPSIPPSIPSTTSSLIDPPQTLASLMAFPMAFNNKHYDLYINFDWKCPIFTDWAYERWGYLEVVLLPPVEMKLDIKAVCSVVGYTLDYILTKERGPFVKIFNHIIQNPAVIPGECWDLNRQFQEYLPQNLTDLHISIYIAMTTTSHSTSSSPGFLRSLVPLGHSYIAIPSPSCKSFVVIADPPSIMFFAIYFTMTFHFPPPSPRIRYPLHFPSAVLQHWVGTQSAITSSHLNTYSITTSFCTFSSNRILMQLLAWGDCMASSPCYG